jgi:hypothetical protein
MFTGSLFPLVSGMRVFRENNRPVKPQRMKITVKKYRSQLRVKMTENLHFFRKWMGHWRDRIVRKGHEKMTVMFIPHNEKNIFNFQISKFTILFFIFLFVVIIVTSGYAVIKNNAVKREEERLLNTYHDIRSHLLRFEKLTNNIEDIMEDLKPEIEELYELAAGSDTPGGIWKSSGR